ncbi:YdcF family protein [Cytobacillus sp. IB215665]|uniref:YdcF family protein n=1 Tax=Cytobacillus sp. IB215665 TaxID=3097357 RepID=UPI002A0FD3A9|nr:YdcF family protein [Cytobacillus sp. IB215665]MDX8368058.1 YdcF family protein [Cytobacillus sp. IB215665]
MKILLRIISIVCFLYALSMIYINGHLDIITAFLSILAIILLLSSFYYKQVLFYISKRKKLSFLLYLFLGLFILMGLTFEILMYKAQNDSIPEDIDYIMVLGSGLKDGKPSATLQNRLNTALDFMKEYPDIKVITTGGTGIGEVRSEGEAMEEYLISLGVEESLIIPETDATSTFENLLYSKGLIDDFENNNRIAIVTSDFHLLRAKMLAKRLDYDPYGVSAKTPLYETVYSHIREYAALVNSFFFNKQ